jgi:hypothetical protein
MPPVGFEPTISADQRPQTYALDGAATGTGAFFNHSSFYISLYINYSHFTLKNCQVKEHHVGKGHLMGNAQWVL